MTETHPRSTAKVAGHPLHPMLIPFPIVLFIAALGSDIGYMIGGERAWALASMWLIGAGLVMSLLAGATGMMDFFGDKRVSRIRAGWLHMIGNLMVVALEAISLYVRWRQGAELAVAPVGITLSFVSAGILGFTGWLGGELVYRHGVGVEDAKHVAHSGEAPVDSPLRY